MGLCSNNLVLIEPSYTDVQWGCCSVDFEWMHPVIDSKDSCWCPLQCCCRNKSAQVLYMVVDCTDDAAALSVHLSDCTIDTAGLLSCQFARAVFTHDAVLPCAFALSWCYLSSLVTWYVVRWELIILQVFCNNSGIGRRALREFPCSVAGLFPPTINTEEKKKKKPHNNPQ